MIKKNWIAQKELFTAQESPEVLCISLETSSFFGIEDHDLLRLPHYNAFFVKQGVVRTFLVLFEFY